MDGQEGREVTGGEAAKAEERRVKPTVVVTMERGLLEPELAAEYLGVSRAKLYQMLSSGELGPQPVRFGGSVRFGREELSAWIRRGCPNKDQWASMRSRALA